MLYLKTQSNSIPSSVVIESPAGGPRSVRLADHVQEIVTEDGKTYEYDEVVFDLPDDREETVESIQASFAAWWEFGQQEEEEATVESRLAALEDVVMEILGV